MNTLLGLLSEPPVPAEPRVTPIRETTSEQFQPKVFSAADSVHEEQIRGLIHQLFFRRAARPVRHVAFAPVEGSTSTATLCLEVASALAAEGSYDIGLIDAQTEASSLHTELEIARPVAGGANWPIAPRLWMVPRESWLPDGCGQRLGDQNLSRLREISAEFDSSILWCGPVSWRTASIGRACDGLVLVLTANKTRRLVAAQVKEHLSKAHVPLLGTVLAQRRFPVPQGLYRSL
jgi:Mrp family chromosome partitioning ATPase